MIKYLSRPLLLLICLVILLVASPVFIEFNLSEVALNILWTVVIMLCAITASEKHFHRMLTGVMAVIWMVLTFSPAGVFSSYLAPLVAMVLIFYTAGLILKKIFVTQEVDLDSLSAAIAVYLLIGIGFSAGYHAYYHIFPDAFLIANKRPEHIAIDFIYYSFVAMTTLGYGDILPLKPVVRMVSVLETVIGGMYLTILVARLVGLYQSPPSSRGK